MVAAPKPLKLAAGMFRPGMRIAVAVSGGADSVALLRTLLAARTSLGLYLSVAHVHHGIRGEEADADAAFVEELAARFSLPFFLERGDVPAAARADRETLEEAARNLRYRWFWKLIAGAEVDAVATAHTLDDQAETVLHRLVRGAWTDGLSGIHPVLAENVSARGRIAGQKSGIRERIDGAVLRPFLGVRRADLEAWLNSVGQPWREDSSNLDQAHTRNRLRHSLLPDLAKLNPQIAIQFAHIAELARDDEDYWQVEMARLLPSLLLPGRPVRGGGRSSQAGENSTAMEVERMRALHPAVRRRVLRAAAVRLGVALNFDETEQLMILCEPGSPAKGGRAIEVGSCMRVERSIREIRLVKVDQASAGDPAIALGEPSAAAEGYVLPIPGEVRAEAFGLLLRAAIRAEAAAEPEAQRPGEGASPDSRHEPAAGAPERNCALVRRYRAGDRVLLRHSRGPRKVKEVFERMRVPANERPDWPLIEWQGHIVWMRGVDVGSVLADAAGLVIQTEPIR